MHDTAVGWRRGCKSGGSSSSSSIYFYYQLSFLLFENYHIYLQLSCTRSKISVMASPKSKTPKKKPTTLEAASTFLGAVWELARLHDPLLTFLAWYPMGASRSPPLPSPN